jgi:hypothetical protein
MGSRAGHSVPHDLLKKKKHSERIQVVALINVVLPRASGLQPPRNQIQLSDDRQLLSPVHEQLRQGWALLCSCDIPDKWWQHQV